MRELDLYFKISKSRGGIYVQLWSRAKGFVLSLGSPEKAYSNSVRLKELEELTEKQARLLTEIYATTKDKKTEKEIPHRIPPLQRE